MPSQIEVRLTIRHPNSCGKFGGTTNSYIPRLHEIDHDVMGAEPPASW